MKRWQISAHFLSHWSGSNDPVPIINLTFEPWLRRAAAIKNLPSGSRPASLSHCPLPGSVCCSFLSVPHSQDIPGNAPGVTQVAPDTPVFRLTVAKLLLKPQGGVTHAHSPLGKVADHLSERVRAEATVRHWGEKNAVKQRFEVLSFALPCVCFYLLHWVLHRNTGDPPLSEGRPDLKGVVRPPLCFPQSSCYWKHSMNPKCAEKVLASDWVLCPAALGPAAGATAEAKATALSAAASCRRHV